MKNRINNLVLAISLISILSGCVALVAGGAAAGGLAITDRRTIGAQTDDQSMELSIRSKALSFFNKQVNQDNFKPTITVVSYNRNILLLGQVTDEQQKTFVEQLARSHTAVNKIYNYIGIKGDRTFSNIANDSWITSKIRAMLMAPKGFSPTQIKVVTYAGVTYAMGILTPEEQAAATTQISTTQGVQKVVTLYETFTRPQ